MNRRSREDEIRNLIKEIKDLPNNISIRSTFIVGFPGETRKKFNKLCEFLKEAQLDNVGFFSYSREENTKAFYMKRQVPEFIKKRRLKKVQKIQDQIAYQKNLEQIGNIEEVIVDSFDEQTGYFEARSERMSPNVDFCVKIPCTQNVEIGKFYHVKYISFENYYFIAELAQE